MTYLGAASPRRRLHIDVVLRLRSSAALGRFIAQVSNPSSPLYRHYLARGQFGPRFGPTLATISKVAAGLRLAGLDVGPVSANDLILPVTTSVLRAERAFGVRIGAFRIGSHDVANANVTVPRLPNAIAPFIQAVVGLDNLVPKGSSDAWSPPASEEPDLVARAGPLLIKPRLVAGQPVACAAAVAKGYYTAADIAQAYDLGPLYAAGDFGADEGVALFEEGNFIGTDVAAYQKCYGINVPITIKPVDGGTSAASTEVTIDVEDVIGLAPRLKKLYVYESPAGDTTDTENNYSEIQSEDLAHVVSTSWAICEPDLPGGMVSAEEPIFGAMVAQGQSVFADSGDYGWAECAPDGDQERAVNYPASSPWVTGVGGTVLGPSFGNPPLRAPEEVGWAGSGGGVSSQFYMPFAWQTGKGVINPYSSGTPCGNTSGYCREVPDVSAAASGGYSVFDKGEWTGFGGTSLATPTWAALMALIDASSARCEKHPVGYLNPTLYQLAASTPDDFNGITSGGAGTGLGYPVTSGYNLVTGLGSPVGANLAQSLCGGTLFAPPASVSGSSITSAPGIAASHGELYAVHINSAAGGASDIYFQTYNGTKWSGSSVVRPGGKPATTDVSPAIAVNGSSPMVAWTDAATGRVEVSELSGRAWSSAVVVGAGKALSDDGPALTGGALICAVWKGRTSDSVWLSTYSDGSWSNQHSVPGASTTARPAAVYFPSFSSIVIAWATSRDDIDFEVDSLLGFGGVASIPGGTDRGPALAVVGDSLFAAWKGTTTNDIFWSADTPGKLYGGAWSTQRTIPNAKTGSSPALGSNGHLLYSAWTGNGSGAHRLWFAVSEPS